MKWCKKHHFFCSSSKQQFRASDKIYEKTQGMLVQNKHGLRNLPAGTMLVKEQDGHYRPARISGEDKIDGILLEPVWAKEKTSYPLICIKGTLTAYQIAKANGISAPKARHKNPFENLSTYTLLFEKANKDKSFAELLDDAGFKVNFSYPSYSEMLKDFSLRYKLEDYYFSGKHIV